ncbi:MAG: hypothetical protein VB099_01145 [Candidatus Limiplasma sp.]|nr:hypothetical protein [Candidatus Limiplasma sp.]
MKKIISLLLAMVLLVPALAIAEDVPTFDFTAEEWLERYKAIVPEGDPFYFDSLTKVQDNEIYAYQAKTEYSGGFSLAGRLGSDLLFGLDFYIREYNFQDYKESTIFPETFLALFDGFAKVILATNPEFTTEDITAIFEALGIDREKWDYQFFKGTYVAEYKGMDYLYSGRGNQRFVMSIMADPTHQE